MSRRKSAPARPRAKAAALIASVRDSTLRKVGVALICAYVAFVPLAFDPTSDASFAVPKALLSHALAYVLAGVLAGLLIMFGRDALRWSWLHVPVVGFLIVNIAATLLAEDRILALYGTHTRMLGLGSIATWTLMYFAVVVLVRSRADVVAIVVAGLGAATVMLAYEALQLFGLDPFSWDVDSAIRPFSTNGQTTTLAGYLMSLCAASFAGAVTASVLPRWMRVVLLCFSAALLFGAAATGTRSALVGLAVGSAVLVGLVWLRHPRVRARSISTGAALTSAVVLAGLLTMTPIGARILQTDTSAGDPDQLARLDLASLDARAVLYRVAADVVVERPILGYGPDNFVVGMTRHRPEHGVDEARLAYATSPHSWIAQMATGSGLTGLVVFVLIVLTAFVLMTRSDLTALSVVSATALAAYLGSGLTSVSDVGSDWLLWVAFGLIAIATGAKANSGGDLIRSSSSPRDTRSHPRDRATGITAVLAWVCVLAGVAVAVTTISAFDASRAAWRSQEWRLAGKLNEAIAAALVATSRDPGRAEYWQRLGLAYVAATRWGEAANALERAVALAPWDVRMSSDLVQTQLILANSGDIAARLRAIQLADDAVGRDRNYPPAHYMRAVVMQFTGNVPEGLRSIERALALSPRTTNARWYVVATQLLVAAGRATDGVGVAEGGLRIVESHLIRIELARALLASGRPQEALAQVESVLAVEPGNAPAQLLRDQILATIPK